MYLLIFFVFFFYSLFHFTVFVVGLFLFLVFFFFSFFFFFFSSSTLPSFFFFSFLSFFSRQSVHLFVARLFLFFFLFTSFNSSIFLCPFRLCRVVMLKTVVYGNQVHSESLKNSVGTGTKLIYVIYSHNKYAYIHIYMFMQHHNDTIIDRHTMIKSQNKRHTQERRRRKTSLWNILPLTLFVRFRKGLLKVCVWEVAGDRTLLKYFDPDFVAVSVVSFSFSMVAQPDPGVNSSVCWLSLLHRVYFRLPLYCLPSFSPISHAVI